MINSLYYDPVYFDAEWGLHHLVRRIVGAVYSGLVELARHFTKILDFILTPKGVVIENIWTGFTTATSGLTIPITVSTANNKYVVVAICTVSGSVGSCTLNGAAMTLLAGTNANRGVYLYGIVPSTTGLQNLSFSTSSNVNRAVVWECSGVNQTSPALDSQTATSASAASISTPSMACSPYGMILEAADFASGTITPSNGQTPVVVNSINTGAYFRPSGSTQVEAWGSTTASACRISATSLNPA